MREEDIGRALETLGLTGKEGRAYLGLVRNGVSTAHQVSQLLGVQYPAVYRILQSLQTKGWIEVSRERPNRYRGRGPRIVAEGAQPPRGDGRGAAARRGGGLRAGSPPKVRGPGQD